MPRSGKLSIAEVLNMISTVWAVVTGGIRTNENVGINGAPDGTSKIKIYGNIESTGKEGVGQAPDPSYTLGVAGANSIKTVGAVEIGGDVTAKKVVGGINRQVSLWHDEAQVVIGGALSCSRDANQMYNHYCTQVDHADANEIEHLVSLQEGTYTFGALGLKTADSGKIDWYLDNTKIVDGQDWYAGSPTYDQKQIHPGIVVAESGEYSLRGVTNGKNTSSSGYYILLTKYWIQKTA